MIGAESTSINGIDPGCSTACVLSTDTDFASFDCHLNASLDAGCLPSLSNISYEMNLVGNKAVLAITNNNDYLVHALQVYVFFFKNGIPCDGRWDYAGDFGDLYAGKSTFIEVSSSAISGIIPDEAKVFFASSTYS